MLWDGGGGVGEEEGGVGRGRGSDLSHYRRHSVRKCDRYPLAPGQLNAEPHPNGCWHRTPRRTSNAHLPPVPQCISAAEQERNESWRWNGLVMKRRQTDIRLALDDNAPNTNQRKSGVAFPLFIPRLDERLWVETCVHTVTQKCVKCDVVRTPGG